MSMTRMPGPAKNGIAPTATIATVVPVGAPERSASPVGRSTAEMPSMPRAADHAYAYVPRSPPTQRRTRTAVSAAASAGCVPSTASAATATRSARSGITGTMKRWNANTSPPMDATQAT